MQGVQGSGATMRADSAWLSFWLRHYAISTDLQSVQSKHSKNIYSVCQSAEGMNKYNE